jgi:hypothetical protein
MMAIFFKSNYQNLCTVITLMIGMIVITPLCGWMFDCGCSWPWAGLDSHCNIYDESVRDQCPWCVSLVFGYLFAGIPLLISSVFTWYISGLFLERSNGTTILTSNVYFATATIGLNLMLCLMVFLVLVLFSGWLAAEITDYAYFIF